MRNFQEAALAAERVQTGRPQYQRNYQECKMKKYFSAFTVLVMAALVSLPAQAQLGYRLSELLDSLRSSVKNVSVIDNFVAPNGHDFQLRGKAIRIQSKEHLRLKIDEFNHRYTIRMEGSAQSDQAKQKFTEIVVSFAMENQDSVFRLESFVPLAADWERRALGLTPFLSKPTFIGEISIDAFKVDAKKLEQLVIALAETVN